MSCNLCLSFDSSYLLFIVCLCIRIFVRTPRKSRLLIARTLVACGSESIRPFLSQSPRLGISSETCVSPLVKASVLDWSSSFPIVFSTADIAGIEGLPTVGSVVLSMYLERHHWRPCVKSHVTDTRLRDLGLRSLVFHGNLGIRQALKCRMRAARVGGHRECSLSHPLQCRQCRTRGRDSCDLTRLVWVPLSFSFLMWLMYEGV